MKFLVAAAVLVAVLGACGDGSSQMSASPSPAASAAAQASSVSQASAVATQGSTDGRQAEPLVAQGHVTDAAGQPLPGAVINADWQLSDTYSIDGTTDENGDYRIALDPPESSWHMNGTYATTWNGIAYAFDLDPVDNSNFVGADGGVRDFVWRLTGPMTPDPDFSYGGSVYVYVDFSGDLTIDSRFVETTLTPDGPLVDGSTGAPVTGAGDLIEGVAVGRYIVTSSYAEPGKDPVELLVRLRNEGDYAASVKAQFEQVSATGQQLELEVRSH